MDLAREHTIRRNSRLSCADGICQIRRPLGAIRCPGPYGQKGGHDLWLVYTIPLCAGSGSLWRYCSRPVRRRWPRLLFLCILLCRRSYCRLCHVPLEAWTGLGFRDRTHIDHPSLLAWRYAPHQDGQGNIFPHHLCVHRVSFNFAS